MRNDTKHAAMAIGGLIGILVMLGIGLGDWRFTLATAVSLACVVCMAVGIAGLMRG